MCRHASSGSDGSKRAQAASAAVATRGRRFWRRCRSNRLFNTTATAGGGRAGGGRQSEPASRATSRSSFRAPERLVSAREECAGRSTFRRRRACFIPAASEAEPVFTPRAAWRSWLDFIYSLITLLGSLKAREGASGHGARRRAAVPFQRAVSGGESGLSGETACRRTHSNAQTGDGIDSAAAAAAAARAAACPPAACSPACSHRRCRSAACWRPARTLWRARRWRGPTWWAAGSAAPCSTTYELRAAVAGVRRRQQGWHGACLAAAWHARSAAHPAPCH